MKRGLLLLAVVIAIQVGCGKKEASAPVVPATVEAPAPANTEAADNAALLGQLTQTLRKFSAEKQRVPKTLQELTAAGYLPALPAAPAGKKFVINEKKVEVELVNE